MGCFNVACSVSKISLTDGDDVVFLPLIHRRYKCKYSEDKQPPRIPGGTTITYFDDFYQPYCLPIYAQYDHYGSIKNVVRDANTEALEKTLEIPLEKIVSSMRGDSPYSAHCHLAEIVISNYQEFKPETELNHKVLTLLGFTKNEDESYEHVKVKSHRIRLLPKETTALAQEFEIVDSLGNVVVSVDKNKAYNSTEKALAHFAHLTGYYPGIDEKFHETLDLVSNLAGMFIERNIYEELTKGRNLVDSDSATPYILKQLGFVYKEDCPKQGKSHGFEIYTHPGHPDLVIKSSERYSSSYIHGEREEYIHGIKSLRERVQKDFNVTLDISPLMSASKYSPAFEVMRDEMQDYEEPGPRDPIQVREFVNKLMQKNKDNNIQTQEQEVENLFNMMMAPSDYSPFSRFISNFMRDNDHFSKLYRASAIDGSIKKHLLDWFAASSNLVAMNVFLFPAMNGYQDGDHRATKRLLEKSLEVINNKLAEQSEWEIDDED